MKTSFISKKLAGKMNGFFSFGNCIVRQDYLHVLSGYALDRTSNGIYVYNFVYPLFDLWDGINLLYSFRLESSEFYISSDDFKDSDIFFSLANKLSEFSEKNKILDLQDFCSYCENYAGLLKNSHAKLTYGFALVLTDRLAEASVVLHDVSCMLRGDDIERCHGVLKALSHSSDYAKVMILKYEEEMINKIKIS